MAAVRLVTLTPPLAPLYKEVRLRALREDAAAFCSTFARESEFPDSVWTERSTHDPQQRVAFLALDENDIAVGLVCCFRDEHHPSTANVLGMWVAPTHRGSGLAQRLMEASAEWAASRGIVSLALEVISTNQSAIAFYQRLGFTLADQSVANASDPATLNLAMSRAIVSSL